MAHDAAALLDELMGRNRNALPTEAAKLDWSDDSVCKYFLVEFCPHDLFSNTKADLGPCYSIHDEKFKDAYQSSSRKGRMGYEDKLLALVESTISDMDRKIRSGRERLAKAQGADEAVVGAKDQAVVDKIKALDDRISGLVAEISVLGSEGKVEEAQNHMKMVSVLKSERESLSSSLGGTLHSQLSSQEKRMQVCEVCGAFLVVGDCQQRVDAHLEGKQHVGFALLRKTLVDLKAQVNEIHRLDRDRDRAFSSRGGDRDRRDSYSSSSSSRYDRDRHDSSSRDRDRDRDRDRYSSSSRGSDSRDRRRSRSPRRH